MRHAPHALRAAGFTLTLISLSLLSACGGGGGSSDTAAAATGTVQVGVTDAPTPDFDHVWVTIKEIRFHTSDAAGPDEAGWLKYPLASPMTVDLTTLNSGQIANFLNQIALPVGHYQQIRLVLADSNDPLTASAAAHSLNYNDQVDFTLGGTGVSMPLEIPTPGDGIAVGGSFDVAAGKTLRLIFDFNLKNDVVKFLHGGSPAFTLKPNLHYFDLDHVGAINGRIDTASLTAAGGYNLVIKAEKLDADGTRHEVVRETGVRPDGSFTLFPVPVSSTSDTVDVVVRGRNIETTIIKGVTVTQGSDATHNATVLTLNPLPVKASTEYAANLATGGLVPTGGWVDFYQTLPVVSGPEVPYEVRFRNGNPYTGNFTNDIELSSGKLQYGNFNPGGDVSLTETDPQEGAGSFQALARAPWFTATAATATVTPMVGATTTVNFPALTPAAGASGDSISGTITQTAGTYDKGYVVVTRRGAVISTMPLDSVLAQAGGTGGAFTVSNIPGGSPSTPRPGAVYSLFVRAWSSAHPMRVHTQWLTARADLRNGSASGIAFTLQ